MANYGWYIERKNIADLKEFSSNPRFITTKKYKLLQQNIKKFGMLDNPIVNLDGTIIAGHQRIRILKGMGDTVVDCRVPKRALSKEEVEELLISHNKLQGEFDFDILANEFETAELLKCGFDLMEFGVEMEPEKPKKQVKPQVILEFVSKKHLEEHLTGSSGIESMSDKWGATLKVKGVEA